jgi:flavin-binding protein dodecin
MKVADQILCDLEQQIELLGKDDDAVERWSEAIDEMIAAAADSLDGIRAKARVACSLRLGDLEEAVVDPSAAHNDRTIENSILRDLIRLYDPHLEHKGAVRALVASIG